MPPEFCGDNTIPSSAPCAGNADHAGLTGTSPARQLCSAGDGCISEWCTPMHILVRHQKAVAIGNGTSAALNCTSQSS